jgi:dihydropteroate synthase type 2
VAAGADIVDVGAASSHPDAAPVAPAEEIRRLDPVLAELERLGVPASVDSFATETQRHCAARGVAMLNDIDGFARPELYDALAAAECKLVVMHSIQGRGPADRDVGRNGATLDDVVAFFDERIAALERAGIARTRLIVDPGMGLFLGTTPEPSLRMLAELDRIRERVGLPVLVSVSRKSFLGAITGRSVGARAAATLAAELWAAEYGADYIRTHDVAALRDGLAVRDAIARSRRTS